MQELLQHFNIRKTDSNPYLQPLKPNAFLEWMENENASDSGSIVESKPALSPHKVGAEVSGFQSSSDINIPLSQLPNMIPPAVQENLPNVSVLPAYSVFPSDFPINTEIGSVSLTKTQTAPSPVYSDFSSDNVTVEDHIETQPQTTKKETDAKQSGSDYINHPLFPPFPMNQTKWQQYAQNPRPPLNPYPLHPYPSVAKATKEAKTVSQTPISNFLTHFKSVDGSYDFPKIMNTAGSMVISLNQISSIVKSVGGFFLNGLK